MTADKPKAGDPFPTAPVPAAQAEKLPGKKAGDSVSVADFKGKVVVVFFYPKANTKGCTIESCGFRDLAARFPKDAVVIGASADDEAAQTKFIKDHDLPFALLCDTQAKLIEPLGIARPGSKMPSRVTYVVGKDGLIAKVYDKVSPEQHPAEVLAFVQSLK
jgi:peroxiredoxin Q/BCP